MRFFLNKEINFDERGFISVIFLISIWILLLFFLGSNKIIRLTQEKIATQSRLDICAVKIIMDNRNLLTAIVRSNAALQASRLAIYSLRGVKLLGPIGAALSGLSEVAILKIHNGIYTFQETILGSNIFITGKNLACAKNQFSKKLAYCLNNINLKRNSRREHTLFPDTKGNLVMRSNLLAQIKCQSEDNLITQISLRGASSLTNTNFNETYEK